MKTSKQTGILGLIAAAAGAYWIWDKIKRLEADNAGLKNRCVTLTEEARASEMKYLQEQRENARLRSELAALKLGRASS